MGRKRSRETARTVRRKVTFPVDLICPCGRSFRTIIYDAVEKSVVTLLNERNRMIFQIVHDSAAQCTFTGIHELSRIRLRDVDSMVKLIEWADRAAGTRGLDILMIVAKIVEGNSSLILNSTLDAVKKLVRLLRMLPDMGTRMMQYAARPLLAPLADRILHLLDHVEVREEPTSQTQEPSLTAEDVLALGDILIEKLTVPAGTFERMCLLCRQTLPPDVSAIAHHFMSRHREVALNLLDWARRRR